MGFNGSFFEIYHCPVSPRFGTSIASCGELPSSFGEEAYLHLRIGPSWYFHDHVEHSLLLICVQWDIMKWGHRCAFFLNVDTVLQCIGRSILADRVPSSITMGSHLIVVVSKGS